MNRVDIPSISYLVSPIFDKDQRIKALLIGLKKYEVLDQIFQFYTRTYRLVIYNPEKYIPNAMICPLIIQNEKQIVYVGMKSYIEIRNSRLSILIRIPLIVTQENICFFKKWQINGVVIKRIRRKHTQRLFSVS